MRVALRSNANTEQGPVNVVGFIAFWRERWWWGGSGVGVGVVGVVKQ
jgi:hypothetical protein